MNKCRALVLSDGGEIRQKVLGEINAARTLLEKSQIEIQEYELTCEPNYRSWLSLEFREILEKTRSLVEDLQKKEEDAPEAWVTLTVVLEPVPALEAPPPAEKP